ncbi:MAG: META domain-containing protein [bacterium]|nr:META domain-containing protein [bacterium]
MKLFNLFKVVTKVKPGILVILVLIPLLSMPGCKKSDSVFETDGTLTGIRWVLESFNYSSDNVVQAVGRFSILFNEDQTVQMDVDCNYCSGAYQQGDRNGIAVNAQVCTEAYCGDDSQDTDYKNVLSKVTGYAFDGNKLILYFNSENSYLLYYPE